MVFSSFRSVQDKNAIYLWQDGRIRKLADHYVGPVISFDGSKVAAVASDRSIEVLDLQGQVISKIATEEPPSGLLWSSLGNQIYYLMKNDTKRIALFRVDVLTAKHEQVFSLPESDVMDYDVSQDGRRIIYSLATPRHHSYGVFVTDDKGANKKEVAGLAINPMWFTDSRHIMAYSNTDVSGNQINKGLGVIFKLDVDTGQRQIIQDVPFMSLEAQIKLSRHNDHFYTSRACGNQGFNIVAWPVGRFQEIMNLTECTEIGGGVSSRDSFPDWYQGS